MRRCWLHLAGLCVIVGCQSTTDANRKLVLTMTTDRTTLSAGDTAHLVHTLTNVSSSTVRIPSPGCAHYFTVVDAAGHSAGPPRVACLASLEPPIDLASGQSLTRHDTWAADSGDFSSRHTLRVAPGTYTLRSMLRDVGRPITITMSVRQ